MEGKIKDKLEENLTSETPAQETQTPKVATQNANDDNISPPPTSKKPPAPKASKPKKKLIILGLVLLFFAGLIGAFVAIAYCGAELPLISKELSYKLQKTYANLPLVPKTARHILLQGADGAVEIEDITYNATLEIGDVSASSSGSFILGEGNESKFDIDVTSKNSNLNSPWDLATAIKGIGDTLYFKVDTLDTPLLALIVGSLDITPMLQKWWRIDISTLTDQESAPVPTDALDEETQKKIFDSLLQPAMLNSMSLKNDEKIEEEMCYHLHVILNADALIAFIEAEQEESLSDTEKNNIKDAFKDIKKFEIDIWSGKNSKLIRKLKIELQMDATNYKLQHEDLGELGSLGGLGNAFEGTFVIEFPKINSGLSITAPEGAQDVEELLQLLYESYESGGLLQETLGEQTKLLLERKK